MTEENKKMKKDLEEMAKRLDHYGLAQKSGFAAGVLYSCADSIRRFLDELFDSDD